MLRVAGRHAKRALSKAPCGMSGVLRSFVYVEIHQQTSFSAAMFRLDQSLMKKVLLKKAILLTMTIGSAIVSENLSAGNAADSFADKGKSASIVGTTKLNIEVPVSGYLSSESKRHYISTMDSFFNDLEKLLDRARAAYPAKIEDVMIGGVRAKLVIPENGISKQNRDRILVNVHGGYFFCSETEALLESIPIASAARIKVISIDYRCSPDNKFPAAIKDVTAVYKSLLTKYAPQHVGIYGCSAGGVLTAESIAWFQREKLPAPGAIGLFCGADALMGGDSTYIWGKGPNKAPYFDGTDTADPVASPTLYPDRLKEFPPTLLVTSSRDALESSVIVAHTHLVKAGVYAELHVWEGMGHGFFMDVDIPESKEMYDVTAKFFNTHLREN